MNLWAFITILAFVLASVYAAPVPDFDISAVPDFRETPTPDILASLTPDLNGSPTPDLEATATLDLDSVSSPDVYPVDEDSSFIAGIRETPIADLRAGITTPEFDITPTLELIPSSTPDLDTFPSSEPDASVTPILETSPASDLNSSPSSDLVAIYSPNLKETPILDIEDRPASGLNESSTPEYQATGTTERDSIPTPGLEVSPAEGLAASPMSEPVKGTSLFISTSSSPDLDESPALDLTPAPGSALVEDFTPPISPNPTQELGERPDLAPVASFGPEILEIATIFISSSPTPDLNESPGLIVDETSSPSIFATSTPEYQSVVTSPEDTIPTSEVSGSPTLDLNASPSLDFDTTPSLWLDTSPTPEVDSSFEPAHDSSPSPYLVKPLPIFSDTPCVLESAPIDFENYKLGMPVAAGAGFTLTTRRFGPLATEDASAVFDSRKPTGNDVDLGSPNEQCSNATGPGVGIGGAPGSIGENCIPLGNLLIAHEENLEALRYECARCPSCAKCAPDANIHGAEFQFTFTGPGATVLHEIVVLDADEKPSAVTIINHSGAILTYGGWGENGKVVIPLYDIKVPAGGTLTVRCSGSCGIAQILRSRCTSYKDEPCTLKTVDFNEYATGARVVSVEDWALDTTRLEGGWARDSSAVFNTSMPTGGDMDLGAPNELCAIPGPGVGKGGQEGSRGANCQSLGQVLIAHTGNVTALRESCSSCPRGARCDGCEPSDHGGGARFRWTFTKAVRVRQIVMMDLNDVAQSASIEMPDTQIFVAGHGKNSLRSVGLGPHILEAGQSMTVKCVNSCAIVKFDYFPCK